MLYKIILLISCLAYLRLPAQTFILSPRQNIAYAGESNLFRYYIPGIPCDSVIIKTDKGVVRNHPTLPCHFILYPDKEGVANIHAFRKLNGTLTELGHDSIQVEESMITFSYLGARKGGMISKDYLLKMGGIIVRIRRGGHETSIIVKDFYLLLDRNGEVRGTFNIGNLYEPESLKLLNTIQIGDKIMFLNIKTRIWNKDVNSPPLEFVIE